MGITDMNVTTHKGNGRTTAILLNKALFQFSRSWLLVISLILIIFNGLPWLAPIFMEQGWVKAGNAIYFVYGFLCHQMPQRSFFLFGSSPMISLETVQTIWQDSANPLLLRQFVGNTAVGWKVAWSDRMVYMYGSPLLFGLFFWSLRRRLKPLSLWGFLLLLLPMAIDGTTHLISELFGGIGGGFRYTNGWLAALTNNAFPATFYSGDAFGSFNSWLRLLSGILFGLGVVWFAYPRLYLTFNQTANQIALKFQKAQARSLLGD
ncbi:MAG: hypothetical protein DHS20C20_05470 [Ardenticatenaceae bacterium]|nr:MAG: hypothetical protein DHS20C20_05470 [Ardenticatenaceae bacterium]